MEVDRAKEKAHPDKHPPSGFRSDSFQVFAEGCAFFFNAEVESDAEIVPAVCLEECCEGFAEALKSVFRPQPFCLSKQAPHTTKQALGVRVCV